MQLGLSDSRNFDQKSILRLKTADAQGIKCDLKRQKSVQKILRVKGNKLIYKNFDNRKNEELAPQSAGLKSRNNCGGDVKIIDY